MTLPLRLRIIQLLAQQNGSALTIPAIFNLLSNEYKGEGQFSLKKIEWHLMSIKAVGLIEGTNPYWDENIEPQQKYKITEAGRKNLLYLQK